MVRSLARGSPSSPRYDAYHSDSDDEGEDEDEHEHGNHAHGEDRYSSQDAERGLLSGTSPTPTNVRSDAGAASNSWRDMLPLSFTSLARTSSPRDPERPDRTR